MVDRKKLYDHPRSKKAVIEKEPEGEEFEEEGDGDEGLAAKERNALRRKHLKEWKEAKDLSPEKMREIQSRHSQEKADLEFDQENDPAMAAPGSESDKKIKAREADRAGARE